LSSPRRPYARVTFSKSGRARFVGHLDLARAFDRAIRRADLPVAYTEGFNPRAKLSFTPSLAVGAESLAEICVVDLARPVDAGEFMLRLAEQLPDGLRVVDVTVEERGRRSPLADIAQAGYDADLQLAGVSVQQVEDAVRALLAQDEVIIQRRSKRTLREENIRPGVFELAIRAGELPVLRMKLGIGDGPVAKPQEVVSAINRELGIADAITVARLVRTSLA